MKALLLGPNGQLGSDLRRIRSRHAPDIELVPLGRTELDLSTASPADIDQVLSAYAFDAVINTTGYHKTDEVEGNAALAFAVNARAVGHLAAACQRRGARLVQVSTDYVFRGNARRPYAEQDGIGPVNVYGASKAMGESLALTNCDGAIVVRVASLFGIAGASGKGGNFVETMLRMARESRPLRVVHDITMSPTSTADAARVILALLAADCDSGIYHVVNDGAATWHEFAVAIMQEAGLPVTVTPVTSMEYPTAAARPAFTVLDHAKASRVAGALPHWRDALRTYLAEKGHVGAGAARAAAS